MTFFSQDDRILTKLAKASFATMVSFVSAVAGFLLIGLFMYLLVEGPGLALDGLFFFLNKLSQFAQFLYPWVV